MNAALRKAASSGEPMQSMTVSLEGADVRQAAVGWLRVGYLVAFATLGYLYILREDPRARPKTDPRT